MHKRAVGCSLAASTALILTLSAIAEIAAAPTAEPGIASSTWTPVTAAGAIFLGQGAFHGDFAPGPIVFGWLAIAVVSALVAVPGLALIVYCLGWAPHPLPAAILGAAWGLAVEVLLINLFLNWLQPDNALYDSLPNWAWWLALPTWGATLGLTFSRAGRRALTRPGAAA